MNLETNQENSASKCDEIRLELDDYMEALIDRRRESAAKEPAATNQPSLAISEQAQDHINNCDECLNYKLENSALIEAAAELPLQADENLTMAIMQALESDFAAIEAMSQNSGQANSSLNSSAHSLSNSASIGASKELSREHSQELYRDRAARLSPPLALALSFVGFTALLCLDDGMVDWSIVSWCIALLVVLSFKPLLEKQQNKYPYAGA
ncbi:MAG: hypothetical protein K2Y32_03125 [Candidatus Obscuribacterales bacterium]|nr:hypothetical protein [Candidatus Obscuribacterales bacterium]